LLRSSEAGYTAGIMFLEVRKKFFDFFEKNGHAIVPSSSLVPSDPSVLFTTAGMQQFKKYYTGELDGKKDFGSARVASIQKCVRTSDIDDVGDDTHLTFFEMLGNFSFNDYWKEEAIRFGYAFLTEQLHISPERMHVSVFAGDEMTPRDEESHDIWRNIIGVPEGKIIFGNRADNFWGPTGSEGPCGPTTEIYVDNVEVWNIVFNEYHGHTESDGNMSFKKSETRGIDTGMGLERLLCMLEGKKHVYETSAFAKLIGVLQQAAPEASERDIRILADHIRTAAFMIGDGIMPSNKDAGYVLRRILRKIMGLKLKNDIHTDIFESGLRVVSEQYGNTYAELKREKDIFAVWTEEYEKFNESIRKGLLEVSRIVEKKKELTGTDAFRLYESYGLPFELLKEVVQDDIFNNISKQEFDEAFRQHQETSRAGAEKKFGGHGLVLDTGELKAGSEEDMKKVIRMHTATHLLHRALRKVLGEGVHQMGSDITPERLRFDFNFDRKLTDEELRAVEDDIREQIRKDLPVYYKEMPKDEAEKSGALHFFKEKYPDTVKVYFIGHENDLVSAEFCNGPHVAQTREIGAFRILKQESLGKDVKRIRATVE
jgi:alanyl-tRNA synthetase